MFKNINEKADLREEIEDAMQSSFNKGIELLPPMATPIKRNRPMNPRFIKKSRKVMGINFRVK